MNSLKIQQFDIVRVVALVQERDNSDGKQTMHRPPRVGDIGTVVEVYATPQLAYHVECINKDGTTNWLEIMLPEEVNLEVSLTE